MITPAMRKVQLLVLKTDLVRVLAWLGKQACMQIAEPELPFGPPGEQRALFEGLQALRGYLALPDITGIPEDTEAPDGFRVAEARALIARGEELRLAEGAGRERREKLEQARREAAAFAGLGLPFRELSRVSFLVLRCGRLSPRGRASLVAGMGERVIVLDSGPEAVMVLASRKARFAIDDELAKAGFVAVDPPPDFQGLPSDLLAALDKEIEKVDEALAARDRDRAALAADCAGRLDGLLASFAMGRMIEELGNGLESTDQVYRLEGWMPASRVDRVASGLDGLCAGRVAIRVFEPREIAAVRNGQEQVPVALRHGRFVTSFERLVISYGTPLYGTIDPTPFVAFFFVLLFAIMFGDLGQGAVILAAGSLLATGKPSSLQRFRAFAPILQAVGGACMLTGLLYGSVFSDDSLLVPLTRAFTAWTGHPVDRIISVLPNEGLGRLVAFFGFSMGVGVVLNSLGLVINIVNRWRLGQVRQALFGKTGLAGALFFWYALVFGVRLALGWPVGPADAIGGLLPLLAMGLGPRLWAARLAAIAGRTGVAVPMPRSFGEPDADPPGMIGFLVETIETLAYYLSNTVSFLRVGAFALAHAVLSLAVFTLSDLVGGLAVGPLWSFLVIAAGNLVILVLEGMIVAIQVTRLQYYEFFSKFFTETGREFRPFRFIYLGG